MEIPFVFPPVAQPAAPAGAAAGPQRDNPDKIKDAARQFEALLWSQVLKSMREAGNSEGWLGSGDDQSGAMMMEVAEEQFAKAMAASGGLGVADLVARGLLPKE